MYFNRHSTPTGKTDVPFDRIVSRSRKHWNRQEPVKRIIVWHLQCQNQSNWFLIAFLVTGPGETQKPNNYIISNCIRHTVLSLASSWRSF